MLLACLAVGIIFLVVLLAYVLIEGWPRLDADLFRNQASQLHPATAGAQAAILGTLWLMAGHGDHRAADRRACSGLSRGVRRPGALVQPADRAQHPKSRRRAQRGLRHPRARVDRARPALAGPGVACRGDHLGAADPAGDHHLQPGGDSRGAGLIARRLACPGRHPMADHLADNPAQQHPGNRYRIDPGAVPSDRRGSAADHHRSRRLPDVQSGQHVRPVHRATDPDLQLCEPTARGVHRFVQRTHRGAPT